MEETENPTFKSLLPTGLLFGLGLGNFFGAASAITCWLPPVGDVPVRANRSVAFSLSQGRTRCIARGMAGICTMGGRAITVWAHRLALLASDPYVCLGHGKPGS
jgi:hypothetical protein